MLGGEPVAITVSWLSTDRAEVQREQIVLVWGTASPGVSVSVSDAGGRWQVDLAAMRAEAEGCELVFETSDGQGKIANWAQG